MNTDLRVILQQLEAEKSVDRGTLIEAIRSAIESAARKSMSQSADVIVEVDPNSISFSVFKIRKVVEEVTDPDSEMDLKSAQELNPEAQLGNRLKVQTEPRDFGRIAAQTAKQVIIQKIKDAERDQIYEEYKTREGEVVVGVVKRMNHGNIVVMIDKAEAFIPPKEQSPRENFRPGDRLRAYLCLVEKTPRGTQLVLSRSTPALVRSLFDMEVPEIYDGTIEIKAIAREPGSRTKVAVLSNDPNVDAVGACVGMKGSRVRAVVEELSGEKIDIVRWSDDVIELCGHALNPADIVDIASDEENKTLLVTVPHDQLSLAIGKKGQNARLASRLIGWNIDIRSDGEEPETPVEPTAEGQGASEDVDANADTPEGPDSSKEGSDGEDSHATGPETDTKLEENEETKSASE